MKLITNFIAQNMKRLKNNHLVSLLLTTILLLSAHTSSAQSFDEYFVNQTLRADYIFSGNANHQDISLSEFISLPNWYGKKYRLSEVPIEGNGQIIMTDNKTNNVIYRNSFSTLFQEWLTYPESANGSRSFENVFLLPMPRNTATVTVQLFNNRREVTCQASHTIDPSDILIRHAGEKDVTPYEVISPAADTTNAINIAFVAEGYTEKEMPKFIAKARQATEALFRHAPFSDLKQSFHIIAVKSPSQESGTSIPRQNIWKNTALRSHFDTFYSDRYLTTLHLSKLHDVLAGTPYEHIIVLVNTAEYGGGGILNSYNLSMTDHSAFEPVVVHEFGHSFAGLADEYAYENEPIPMYPNDVEPWEQNITTKVNFSAKWQDLNGQQIDGQQIGLIEGAGYSLKGVFRPCQNCRMRTNEYPEFCPICRRAIRQVIDFYTKP